MVRTYTHFASERKRPVLFGWHRALFLCVLRGHFEVALLCLIYRGLRVLWSGVGILRDCLGVMDYHDLAAGCRAGF